jgi:hypothetical protein
MILVSALFPRRGSSELTRSSEPRQRLRLSERAEREPHRQNARLALATRAPSVVRLPLVPLLLKRAVPPLDVDDVVPEAARAAPA